MTGNKIIPNQLVNAENALRNSDIFSLVSRISSDIASAKFLVPGQYDQLLNKKPDHLINSFNFWQQVVASMMLNGNAYVVIHSNQEEPELELIPCSWIINIDLTDYGKDILYTVDYHDERGQQVIKSANMLHFKLFMYGTDIDNDRYVGVSPLMALTTELNISGFSNRLTLATLKHAIAPNVLLTVPEGTLEPEEVENIRNAWEAQTTGENNGRAIVLDQGLQMSKIDINANVADFLNNANFSRDQIAKAFNVPSSVLNGTGDAQSSVQMLNQQYVRSLNLYIEPIEAEIRMKLGIDCELDINGALDVDNSNFIKNINTLTGNQPVISTVQAQQALIDKGLFINNIDLNVDQDNTQMKGGEQDSKQ